MADFLPIVSWHCVSHTRLKHQAAACTKGKPVMHEKPDESLHYLPLKFEITEKHYTAENENWVECLEKLSANSTFSAILKYLHEKNGNWETQKIHLDIHATIHIHFLRIWPQVVQPQMYIVRRTMLYDKIYNMASLFWFFAFNKSWGKLQDFSSGRPTI